MKHIVGFWHEKSGYATVEADTVKEAEAIVVAELNHNGTKNLKYVPSHSDIKIMYDNNGKRTFKTIGEMVKGE